MGWQDGTPVASNSPPTATDIPGAAKQPAWMQGTPVEQKNVIGDLTDIVTSAPQIARSVLQNTAASGLANVQAIAEDLAKKITGRYTAPNEAQKRAEELQNKWSYQTDNPVVKRILSGVDAAANSELLRPFQGLGPGGGIIGEAGLVQPAVSGAEYLANRSAAAAQAGSRAISDTVNRASNTAGRAIDFASGKAADDAAQALKSRIAAEANAGKTTLESQAAELQNQAGDLANQANQAVSGRAPEVSAAQDIASAKSAAASKIADKAAAAESATQGKLAALHPTGMSNEDIGALIQEKGTANIEAQIAARQQEAIENSLKPAMADARTRAAAGDTLTTNAKSAPIIQDAHQQFLQQISDMRLTASEKASLMQKADAMFKGEPLTLQQAEYLRRFFNDPMTRDASGFGALKAHDMGALGDTMTEAMKAYDPRIGNYIDAYREGSQNIERSLGSNAGKAATNTIDVGADVIRNQKPIQAHNYYMKGDEAGAQRMVALAGGKTTDLIDAVKANLRTKLEGLTADQAMELADKNSGLLKVFPEAKQAINDIIDAKFNAEKFGRMAPEASKRAAQAFDAVTEEKNRVRASAEGLQASSESAVNAAKVPQALADDIKLNLAKLEDASNQEALSTTRSLVDKLAQNKLIDEEKYKSLLADIRSVDRVYGQTAKAKSLMRGLVIAAVGSTIGYAGIHATGL